jgi:hypothetical protein
VTPVGRDQFQFRGDLEVIHLPTGATVSTYRYDDPAHACSTINVNFARAGERLDSGGDYDRWDVVRVACELLRERAMEVG